MPKTISYTLTDLENLHANNFMEEHELKHGPDKAAAGGRYSWYLHPCGIGTATEIVCNQCKEVRNITEYEAW